MGNKHSLFVHEARRAKNLFSLVASRDVPTNLLYNDCRFIIMNESTSRWSLEHVFMSTIENRSEMQILVATYVLSQKNLFYVIVLHVTNGPAKLSSLIQTCNNGRGRHGNGTTSFDIDFSAQKQYNISKHPY